MEVQLPDGILHGMLNEQIYKAYKVQEEVLNGVLDGEARTAARGGCCGGWEVVHGV